MTGQPWADVLIVVAAVITAWQTIWKRAGRPVLVAARRANVIYEAFAPEGEYAHMFDAVKAVGTEVRGLSTDLRAHMDEETFKLNELMDQLNAHRAEDTSRFDEVDRTLQEIRHVSPPSGAVGAG